MDQVFVERQVCEQYLSKWKEVFWACMNLEKVYETIDRHGMWQRVRVYGVRGKLWKAVQCLYVECWACIRVGNDVSEWFPVNVVLFIIYVAGGVPKQLLAQTVVKLLPPTIVR